MNKNTSLKINLVLATVLISACGTVTQKTNESRLPSYDGNARNSGILALAPGGGRIVTPHYHDRYNALIDLYGDQFDPPLKHDEGIAVNAKSLSDSSEMNSWIIDKEHHIKMGQMIQWKRDGRPATGGFKKLINKIL